LERDGRTPGLPDTMITSSALAEAAVLVTNDRAFRRADGLRVEDWSVAGN